MKPSKIRIVNWKTDLEHAEFHSPPKDSAQNQFLLMDEPVLDAAIVAKVTSIAGQPHRHSKGDHAECGFVFRHQDDANYCVAVTSFISVFLIRFSRGQQVAKELLGEAFGGFLVSDKRNAYNWLATMQRQLC